MNMLKKLTTPPWLALVLGIPSLAFMAILCLTGQDDRELFLPGHFAGILVWMLTPAMILLTALSLRRYTGKAKYTRMFPVSTTGAAGILCAAVAVLWSTLDICRSNAGALGWLLGLLGLAAGGSLVYLAWCRFRGLRSSYLLWAAAVLFLMLRLMFCYRTWSAEPELLRYCFPLFASVCVTLAFYYRTAFGVGLGNRRMYLLFSQIGAFFCLTTLGGGVDLFYLGMLLWCLLDLPALRPFKSDRQTKPEVKP